MLEKAEKVADNTVHINLGNYNQYNYSLIFSVRCAILPQFTLVLYIPGTMDE